MPQEDARYPGEATWSVDNIRYDRVERELVKFDARLFYLITSASFIEITSDLYTRNLVEFFGGGGGPGDWLQHRWEPEELQHGVSLKRYVQKAWPDFDWDGTYRNFYEEYSKYCSVELLEPQRTLELAARCVVEIGTSSFYRMVAASTQEPVLTELASNISSDEVRHYKNFLHYFWNYEVDERPGRLAVLRTLWGRIREIDSEDAFLAFKHIWLACHPGEEFNKRAYEQYRRSVRDMAKLHYPGEMAVKMLLKPLDLSPAIGRVVVPLATSATKHILSFI